MGTAFDHEDHVGAADGREAVGDRDRRPPAKTDGIDGKPAPALPIASRRQ
jgi:hypothetical protein